MNLADYQIRKKIQGGDIREFERLFLEYFKPLCRHAYLLLGDMDQAEDIVQEFFYNFWKNREEIIINSSLNAYLFQSIRNNAIRCLEQQALKREYTEQLNTGTLAGTGGVNQELGLKELNGVIESTLKKLPERCSMIFRLNRFEGKKYREIAEMLAISVKTVEADMGKALQQFRESLREYRNALH